MAEDLASFVEKVTGESHLRVEEDLGDGFVRLRSAEAERRQAKHDVRSSEDIVIEMLRNSRDAHAECIYLASWKDGDTRNLTVIDDGDGIPETMYERVFDARVTSKLDTMHMDLWGVHGRGMALYAVKVNADVAYVVTSKVDGGTVFHVEANTDRLGERRDQSTAPAFLVNGEGVVTVRGPRNIIRTASEFAYIERARCSVFLGSSADIAATLWESGRAQVSQSIIAFCKDPNELSVCKRLALATTPEEFARISQSLGLPLSNRTARRIMSGEIKPLDPLDLSIVPFATARDAAAEETDTRDEPERKPSHREQGTGDVLSDVLFRDTRGLKIAKDDRDDFQKTVVKAFRKIARSYYLDETVQPEIRYRKDRIDVLIPVVKID